MNSEDKIKQLVGKKEPFKVPDGYFEQFHLEIMSSIADKKEEKVVIKVPLWTRLKPVFYLAACFAGAFMLINTLRTDKIEVETPSISADLLSTQDDEMMDYFASANEFAIFEAMYSSDNNGTIY